MTGITFECTHLAKVPGMYTAPVMTGMKLHHCVVSLKLHGSMVGGVVYDSADKHIPGMAGDWIETLRAEMMTVLTSTTA